MQNRSAIWIFTVLLTLACLYQLSFSYFTRGVENEADRYGESESVLDSLEKVDGGGMYTGAEMDSIYNYHVDQYLKDHSADAVYPLIGYTYQECKDREMAFGLDLQGGMSVTLEVSIYDLVKNLAGTQAKTDTTFQLVLDRAYEMQASTQEDFITLFGQAWGQVAGDKQMGVLFHLGNRDIFEDPQMSNEEVLAILSDRAKAAIGNTKHILENRINKFGVSQPTIETQELSGRILIDLPGVKDKQRVRNLLQSTANLEFWECYHNYEVVPFLQEADSLLRNFLYPDEDFGLETGDSLTNVLDSLGSDTMGTDTLVVEGIMPEENDSTDIPEESSDELSIEEVLGSGDFGGTDSAMGTSDLGADAQDFSKSNPLLSRIQFNLSIDEASQQTYLNPGALIGYVSVSDTAILDRYFDYPVVEGVLPINLALLWGNKAENDFVPLFGIKKTNDNVPLIDGENIVDARMDFAQFTGESEVTMYMDEEGAEVWKNLTKAASSENPKRCIAIVMDNYVYSAPTVKNEIGNGISNISGGFTMEEATDLANILKAGALPAPAIIIDESVVGPTLGKKNIEAGLISVVIALLVVLVYMAVYYAKAGLVADVALLANIFFILGTLASLQASLTLAGIAGIVLTIGMSVDANVLIFERIREEVRAGKGIRLAIKDGYKQAYSAIVDANVTTLLTAIVLVWFGSGTIESFATTLIIGIFCSLFAAIFITRLIFTRMMDKKREITFASKLTENAFTRINIKWVKKRKIFYLLSALVIAGGIVSMASRGLDLGVEFVGGRTYLVEFNDVAKTDVIREELSKVFVSDDGVQQTPEVKIIETDHQVKITTKYMIDANSAEMNVDSIVEAKLHQGLDVVVGESSVYNAEEGWSNALYTRHESRKVDKRISDDIMTSSVWAVCFALIIIFLYIVLRFRKWQYGLGAILATFHDVLVVLGLFSIFYGVLPFSMEIDQAFIAAILTVVGYSINDTVVVFDRIREYLGIHKKQDEKEVVNDALNSTLSRTVNTSVSTFVVLLTIFIFGGEAIRGFIFALMIGVVVGTYSSLCIATPSVIDLSKSLKKIRKAG